MVFYSYLYDKLKAERKAVREDNARKKRQAETAIELAEMRVKLAKLEREYGIAPSQNDMSVALAEMRLSIARLNFKNYIHPSETQIDAEVAELGARFEAVNRKRDAEIAAEPGSD